MMARLPAGLTPLAWRGALVLAAATAVVVELAYPWEQPADLSPPALGGATELRRPGPPPTAAFPAIAEHPLFHPSRAPWVAPPAPAPQVAVTVPAPPGGYILSGVVLSGGMRSAILKNGSGGKTVLIGEGEALNGWTLRRIDAAGLHFEAGGQTFDLPFPHARPSGR
jgi:hypothetical protein